MVLKQLLVAIKFVHMSFAKFTFLCMYALYLAFVVCWLCCQWKFKVSFYKVVFFIINLSSWLLFHWKVLEAGFIFSNLQNVFNVFLYSLGQIQLAQICVHKRIIKR